MASDQMVSVSLVWQQTFLQKVAIRPKFSEFVTLNVGANPTEHETA